jgi:Skp family chaperone for outer membrane proteins
MVVENTLFINTDWFKILTLIGSLFAALVYFHLDINKQIEKIDASTTKQIDRMEANIQNMSAKLEASMQKQAERSDRLYEMFVDLLKAQKK